MSIQVKRSTMVRPAKETPQKSVWLSNLDLIRNTPYAHVPVLYIYKPITIDEKNVSNNFFDSEIMKDSLSRILVPYYPVAGRLRKNHATGRIEINCNAAGALLVEAEATTRLNLDEFEGIGLEYRKLVMPTCDYSGGISSFPLLMAQITRFECGGVCICFATHHHVADGMGYFNFINSWARLAKGLELDVLPFHRRDAYLAARNPPQVKFEHTEYEQPALPLKSLSEDTQKEIAKECMFKIFKDHIHMLKLEASTQPQEVQRYELSTYTILAGHIWRCASKARGLTGDQVIKLYIPTDGRSRLYKDSTKSQMYFGNVIFFTTCTAKASEITEKPLWYAASKIQEALENASNMEYLRSAIDYLDLQSDLTRCARGPHCFASPNLSINSWARLPLYEADFGWGKPKFVGRGEIRFEGESYIVPSPNKDGSFSLYIKLFSSHMPLFKKYLYHEWSDERLCDMSQSRSVSCKL